ncbi:MAG: MFS transporter, partial [Clostridia bacterium]|nr:MFS transporter [Clostridia bacterium]
VVAFPFAILFGRLAKKYSTRKLLETAILIYFGIALFAFQLDKTWEFWMLAAMVGGVQGGVQALSRSFFARLIPKERSNEFFGFYDIFGKSASFVGTTLMGVIITATNKPNLGVIPIAVMFVIGYLLLRAVPKQENE